MGTDVHLVVEKKNDGKMLPEDYSFVGAPDKGEWGLLRGYYSLGIQEAREFADTAQNQFKEYWVERLKELTSRKRIHFLYAWRNYDLFAILAGVRNGLGFGGCDTGDPVEAIAEDRGLPADMSAALEKIVNRKGGGGEREGWLGDHSFSHITLWELMRHDWRTEKTNRGFVDLAQYRKCLAAGKSRPEDYCGGVWGNRVKTYTVAEMRRNPLTPAQMTRRKITHPQLEWPVPHAVACDGFFTGALPTLARLATGEDYSAAFTEYRDALADGRKPPALPKVPRKAAENIRIVFGFDS